MKRYREFLFPLVVIWAVAIIGGFGWGFASREAVLPFAVSGVMTFMFGICIWEHRKLRSNQDRSVKIAVEHIAKICADDGRYDLAQDIISGKRIMIPSHLAIRALMVRND